MVAVGELVRPVRQPWAALGARAPALPSAELRQLGRLGLRTEAPVSARKASKRPALPASGVRAVPGGGAQRREGGAAPLTDQQYRETTWRAPWAAPYALSRR